MKNAKIKLKPAPGREVHVIINNIDSVTSKDEIEKEIRESLSNDRKAAYVKVKSLSPNAGFQTATVALEYEDADRLIKGKRIHIGLSSCKVREKRNIQRCYRCWGYGHTASTCKGTGRMTVIPRKVHAKGLAV